MKNLFLITLLGFLQAFCMEYHGNSSCEDKIMATNYSDLQKSLIISILRGNYSFIGDFFFSGENINAHIEFNHYDKSNPIKYEYHFTEAKKFVVEYLSSLSIKKKPLIY